MEENHDETEISTVVGYILLTPPLIGVFLFLKTLFFKSDSDFLINFWQTRFWSGGFENGGFSSPMPIYLGLMAIAGAYLIKNTKK